MGLSRRELGLVFAAAAAMPRMAVAAGGDQDAALTAYLDAEYEKELQFSPEQLTRIGRKDHYGEWSDRSEAGMDRALAWRRKSVADMKARFSPAGLGEEARTSFDVWALELTRDERDARFRRQRYIFDRGGSHTAMPNFLINSHRVDEPADMDAFIARVAGMAKVLDQSLARAKQAAAGGVRMPRFAYDQCLDEIVRLNRGAPFMTGGGDSALFANGKAKIAGLKARGKIDDAQAQALTGRLAAAMLDPMKPAYDRVAAWLTADRANTSAEPQGAIHLPDGAAFYDAMLADQTTTTMTAEEIHQLGLREVARLRGEMEALKGRIGFKGTLDEFFVFMRTDPQFYLPNTDEGRAKYLKMAEVHLGEIKTKLPAYFGRLPKADLIVKRVEAFREEPGGAAHYSSGAPDGSRPGIFYVHLADTAATPTYELEGTAYHEGLPGHHMQISIGQELTGLPKFRTQYGYGAFAEGWGLYSEQLAKEMGQYVDPYSDFGRLSRDIWRGIRLVVDTGIHAKGWSETQALSYYTTNSPQPAAKILSEVRRYFVTPGQATSYKVGQVRIQAIRDRSRQKLGSRFDYRSFHDMLLGGGSLPIPVLEGRSARWLARQT